MQRVLYFSASYLYIFYFDRLSSFICIHTHTNLQEVAQLKKMREEYAKHHEEEISHHEDEIKELEEEIRRHKEKIARHKTKVEEHK